MFNSTLDNKPFFTRPDGIIVRDLTQSVFDLNDTDYIKYDVYKVPKEYVMRPDLISQAVYNTSTYAEIILKYNSISNPFSINEGDIILIPEIESAKRNIKTSTIGSDSDKAEQLRQSYKYIDPLKKPKTGGELEDFNNRDISNDDVLPPNLAEAGTSQIIHRAGRVYFGEGVESCLKSGISSGEFLSSVILSNK